MMEARQPVTANQRPVQRAEDVLDGLGRRVGRLAGGAGQSVRKAAAAAREAANTLDRPGPGAMAGDPHAATERAEQLVDQWSVRLGQLLGYAGRELERAAAFAREEVEDMWAEAQEIRRASRQKPD